MSLYVMPLLAFFVTFMIILITPGLDMAMMIRTTVNEGRRAGLGAACGICLGLGVWGLATVLGLSTVLAASAVLFTALKWAGACYLVWQGIKLILWPRAQAVDLDGGAAEGQSSSFGKGVRLGFLCNILNPKVGIIFISLLPQFIPTGVNTSLYTLFLTGFQIVIASLWYVSFVLLIVPIKSLITKGRFVTVMDRVTGCVFVGLGLKLVLTKAPTH
ncbi:LysE family translocator [Saccharibacter floricola]|uniref:Lysine/threonine exporter protein LysE n=1 Tax=Saccharibacter floricola DSM 15669 TaxID=1123227 RepID=A0ABQ0NYA0_9PROT|nr:LysE family translocator [Saccharibacter floricola]GBQ06403.1 lysine/threonine exporter protein LysE [Saccharibacter floricola DSM 15669]